MPENDDPLKRAVTSAMVASALSDLVDALFPDKEPEPVATQQITASVPYELNGKTLVGMFGFYTCNSGCHSDTRSDLTDYGNQYGDEAKLRMALAVVDAAQALWASVDDRTLKSFILKDFIRANGERNWTLNV